MADLRIRQNARNVNVLKDVLRTLNNTDIDIFGKKRFP
jgi:hypothetical protein